MTVTCWSTSPRLAADRNRLLSSENAMIAMSRTASGPRIGRACRTCWIGSASDSEGRWATGGSAAGARVAVPAPDGASPPVFSLVIGTSRSVGERRPSAPAVLLAEGGVLGLDPGLRLVGDQVDPGVGERLARGRLWLGAVLGELGDRRDTLLGHLQRVLLGGGAELAGLARGHARAPAVDRDDRDVVLLAGRLQRGVRARRRRLVDRVHEVDRRVLLQEGLHRRTAAVLGALGQGVA